MLLKIKLLFVLLLLAISSIALAQKINFLQVGVYQSIESMDDNKKLCPEFEILKQDLSNNNISFSGLYNFELKNSKHLVDSDIDPNCQFKEVNTIENKTDRTVLIRVNQEICKGQIQSNSESKIEITNAEIKLHHKIDGAALDCIWRKK